MEQHKKWNVTFLTKGGLGLGNEIEFLIIFLAASRRIMPSSYIVTGEKENEKYVNEVVLRPFF